jgi:hypothetical protein
MLYKSSGSVEVFRTSCKVIDAMVLQEAARLEIELHPEKIDG